MKVSVIMVMVIIIVMIIMMIMVVDHGDADVGDDEYCYH